MRLTPGILLAVLAVPAVASVAQAAPPTRADVAGRASTLAAAWIAAHGSLPRDASPPVLVAGSVLTPTLNVAVPPAAPAIKLRYTADSSGLNLVVVDIAGPDGQGFSLFAPGTPSSTSGSLVIQQPTGFPGAYEQGGQLSLYAAPGMWSITSVNLIAADGQGTYYTGSQLAAVFRKPEFSVVNTGSPDTTPPTASKGAVLTPTISLSSDPTFRARLTVADDLSGVANASLTLMPPSGLGASTSTQLTAPVANGTVLTTTALQTSGPFAATTGTWTIAAYRLCDIAGNCVTDGSAADIRALLGTNTFTVTQ